MPLGSAVQRTSQEDDPSYGISQLLSLQVGISSPHRRQCELKKFGEFPARARVATGFWEQSPALIRPDVTDNSTCSSGNCGDLHPLPSSLFFFLPSDLRTSGKWSCILLRRYTVTSKTFIKHLLCSRHCSRHWATKDTTNFSILRGLHPTGGN